MEYVYLAIAILAILIITNTALKKIDELERNIKLKDGIIREKTQHEKLQQEIIDQLVKDKRELRKKIEEYENEY